MNIEIAQKIIKELVNLGIHSFCLCPGGRLAPFVEVLSHSKGLELLSFFEERSAGFFALGRVRRDKKPIAVLCTSGTAVAELLPSVIEAHYSALPLVLITADRPLEFGRKGSPQTLKKALSILKDYCHTSKNILKKRDIDFVNWSPSKGNLHLNVCFDEPLIDKKISPLKFSGLKKRKISITPLKESFYLNDKKQNLKLSKKASKEMESFFKICKKPLLLIGELRWEEKPLVKKLLTHYKGLFYVEPLSGLEDIKSSLLSGEKILNYALNKKEIDGVIRLGGVPRVRLWRDLEKQKIPVLSLSSQAFKGLARASFHQPLIEGIDLLKPYLYSLAEYGSSLKKVDQIQLKKWKDILKTYPQSEDFWFWVLKKNLKENSQVFLGNSSPIRLWDKIAFCRKKDLYITGQAGVNGIDGLVSRFLGECDSRKNNVGIFGDLSLLYDMAGFWRSKALPPWTIFVINNFGGQIFSQLFKNPAFLNEHKLSFSSLAKMWGINYELYKDSKDFSWSAQKPYTLVEICPKEEETKACFKDYVSIWDEI